MRTTPSGSLSKRSSRPDPCLFPFPFRILGEDVELTAGDLLEEIVAASRSSRIGVFVALTSQKSGELLCALSSDEVDEGVTLTPAGPLTPMEWYPQSLAFVAAEYLDDKICRCSLADAFPVTIGESLPSLLEFSMTTTEGDALAPNFVGVRNSGDDSRSVSLLRRSCGFVPASGDELRTDPIESDSSVAELDSSTLHDALSAISEIIKKVLLTFIAFLKLA